MIKSITEILTAAEKIDDINQRVEFLKANNSNLMMTLMTICYDPTVHCLLPEGSPPYKKNPSPESHGIMYSLSNLRKLKIFFAGNGYDHLTSRKREELFIGMLESIDAKDAELICQLKDKKMPYRKINRSVIAKAFPEIQLSKNEESVSADI